MNVYKSERIYLKEIRIEDINDSVMTWFDDEDLMRFYSNSKNKITKEILLKSIEEGKLNGNLFTYGIFINDSDDLIGTMKLGPINIVHKTSDLVALIGNRKFLGKGLAVEAITLGSKLAFNEFDIRKLYGGMYISNIASIKAYHRAGWIIEGRLKGFYRLNDKNEDRILMGCYNTKYFSQNEINELKANENRYFSY